MIALSLLPCHTPPGTPWVAVETASPVRTLEALRDEMQSWTGPRIGHGDLVRVVSAEGERLLVADPEGTLHEVPGITASAWEAPALCARDLVREAGMSNARQIAWCALALARSSLPDNDRLHEALETAERFMRGWASRSDLSAASEDVWSMRESTWSPTWVVWAALQVPAAAEIGLRSRLRSEMQMVLSALEGIVTYPIARRAHADLVRRFLPLPGVACARAGLPWPLPEVTT